MKKEQTEIEALRAEIESLRQQVQQQTATQLPDGAEVKVAHVVRDKFNPIGLNPELAPFYAARDDKWRHHPHNETWARRNGYRKAEAGDFVETDGMSPSQLHSDAMGISGEVVLYVCPREHQERRRHEAEQRSRAAANQPPPKFVGPYGDATVKEA